MGAAPGEGGAAEPLEAVVGDSWAGRNSWGGELAQQCSPKPDEGKR